jgi:tetratricopeptide (TPR) repeat protein
LKKDWAMKETLSKRSRSHGTVKKAARPARSKTSAAPKRGSPKPRRAVSAAPKRAASSKGVKPTATSAKSAAQKKTSAKTSAKSVKASAKKTTIKAKPRRPTLKSKPKAALKKAHPASRGKAAAKTRVKAARKLRSKHKVSPPPPPEPPRRKVASAVLRAFDHAVKVFNRRQFAEAKPLFESIQHQYPDEVEINARAQTYIHVCAQKLARPPSSPRNADELYDRGVVALNIGDFTQARSFFEKALRLRPDSPHVLYSLAVTHAQTGAPEEALDYLNRSIQMQPRFRAQALNDTDFSELREDKRFLEMLGITSPFDLLEARR